LYQYYNIISCKCFKPFFRFSIEAIAVDGGKLPYDNLIYPGAPKGVPGINNILYSLAKISTAKVSSIPFGTGTRK